MHLRRHGDAAVLAVARDGNDGIHQRIQLEYPVPIAALVEGEVLGVEGIQLPKLMPQADDHPQGPVEAEPPLRCVLRGLEKFSQVLHL